MQFKRMTGYKNSFKIGIIETCKWKVNLHPKKTHLYKSVFKRNLKIEKEIASLISSGRLFQRVGALRLRSHIFTPFHFQWDSLWCSCDGHQHIRRRLLPQTFPTSEVELGSAFWSLWSTSHCGCQSCVLAIWHQDSELHHSTVILTSCCVNYVSTPVPHNHCTILSAFFAALGLAWTETES